MAVYTNAGGGGGTASDELTATRGDVLKGVTAVTSDSNDEAIEGTLELTGDAADSHVLEGKTFYNQGAKTRRTGAMPNRGAANQTLNAGQSYTIPAGYHNGGGKVTANGLAGQTAGTALAGDIYPGKTAWVNGVMLTGAMAVYSVVSFSIAVTGSSTVTATWVWPSRGPYSGVAINYKTDWYPTSPWDGTRAYTGTGTNHNLGAASAAAIGGLQPSTTYYFSIWVYCSTSNGDMFSGCLQAAGTTIPRGMQTFTSSGVFVVPAGVTSIDVFCVGGGSNGCIYISSDDVNFYGAGGGAGYTSTAKGLAVSPGQQYAITVAAGAYDHKDSSTTYDGGTSQFGNIVSAAGGAAYILNSNMEGSGTRGGKGGSGGSGAGGSGGSGGWRGPTSAPGGIDGNKGTNTYFVWYNDSSRTRELGIGGSGQGRTTRAFGEAGNTLYASGGNGALSSKDKGSHGAPNTGNGGNGAAYQMFETLVCNGGSGVVLVRWGY